MQIKEYKEHSDTHTHSSFVYRHLSSFAGGVDAFMSSVSVTTKKDVTCNE